MGQHRPYIKHIKKALQLFENNSNIPDSWKVLARKAYREVKITMSSKMRRSAGLALSGILMQNIPTNPEIRLSKIIFEKITDEEKFETVSHEFAHIVDYYIRQNSNHDEMWQTLHRAMGGNSLRTHKFETKPNKVKRYIVSNGEKEYMISKKKLSQLMCTHWFNVQYKILRVEEWRGREKVSAYALQTKKE